MNRQKYISLCPALIVFLLLTFSLTKSFACVNMFVAEIKTDVSGLDFNHSNIEAVTTYHASKQNELTLDSIQKFKDLAIYYANNNESALAATQILNYVKYTGDMSFFNDHVFFKIKNSNEYRTIKQRFSPDFNPLSILYIYAGLLGFFVFVVLNIKRGVDKRASFIISLFILFHSVFILHLSLYVNNIQYYLPHTLYISTTFSFLYGPLLYFYFKCSVSAYRFKWLDLLHLIPTLGLLVFLLPFYRMSGLEKFAVLFDPASLLLPGGKLIILVKTMSLIIYGGLILRIYYKNLRDTSSSIMKNKYLWQRNLIALYVIYIFAYVIYAVNLTDIIHLPSLFHLQILVMVGVVFYVTYIAYVQPEIFKGKISLHDPMDLFKYKKSGLTASYSHELKTNLLQLMHQEKVYKQNDISLESLSDMLQTTRHNTSQVINEQFGMNFFELINSFRINEAQEIFKNDAFSNFNIIEVAYEVGFNNKVTFNKSFKKQVAQTPSQYIKSLQA